MQSRSQSQIVAAIRPGQANASRRPPQQKVRAIKVHRSVKPAAPAPAPAPAPASPRTQPQQQAQPQIPYEQNQHEQHQPRMPHNGSNHDYGQANGDEVAHDGNAGTDANGGQVQMHSVNVHGEQNGAMDTVNTNSNTVAEPNAAQDDNPESLQTMLLRAAGQIGLEIVQKFLAPKSSPSAMPDLDFSASTPFTPSSRSAAHDSSTGPPPSFVDLLSSTLTRELAKSVY
jgi:hypothetical protein